MARKAVSFRALNVGNKLSVEYFSIDKLGLDPRNARVHTQKQIRQIAESIKSFGFNVPILVDKDLKVIAGHGRVLAAKQFVGSGEVPTIRLDHLTEAQRRAFMIADNRLTEIAQWDDRLLAEQLRDLANVDLDFDIEGTGFEIGEIDLRIESLSAQTREKSEPAIPVVCEPAITKYGDLWLLDRHKLLCGSALETDSYRKLMATDKAALVFTDPPYNVPIDGHVSGLGQIHHREFPMAIGELTSEGFTQFLDRALSLMASSSHCGSLIYVCMDWRHLGELLTAGKLNGFQLINLCVWAKPNAGMGSFYRSQHELVPIFKAGSGPHRNNIELGRHGRNRTNVWAYAAGPGFGRAGEEGRLAELHPTVKPVAMVADAILDSSRPGDVVLDPFLGSGTTLMAAERTRRHCYGIELDPLYVDVILRRWQAHTGGSARHALTGSTFDEIVATRAPGMVMENTDDRATR
jgi:DNA modification methylase